MNKEMLTIEEIHNGTIIVLLKIIEICDRLNINYYIAYGSLIGAVRHKGFIPWDDDMDLIMLRPEYEKFVNYCLSNQQQLLPFKLICKYNNKNYPYNIPRFCDMRYVLKNENSNLDADLGLFIDIYPFDGCGDDINIARKRIELKRRFYQIALHSCVSKKRMDTKKGIFVKIIYQLIYWYSLLYDRNYFFDKLDSLGKLYDIRYSKYVECVIWNSLFRPIDKQHYEGYEILEFEGIKVKAPKDYDTVLRNIYGDYMKLPPLEKRIATHSYKLYRRN